MTINRQKEQDGHPGKREALIRDPENKTDRIHRIKILSFARLKHVPVKAGAGIQKNTNKIPSPLTGEGEGGGDDTHALKRVATVHRH